MTAPSSQYYASLSLLTGPASWQSPATYCKIGDSILANARTASDVSTWLNPNIGISSGYTWTNGVPNFGWSNGGIWEQAMRILRWPMNCIGDFSCGGSTLVSTNQPPYTTANPPSILTQFTLSRTILGILTDVVVMNGGQNDIGAGSTYATVTAALNQIYQACISAGVFVIDFGCMPNPSSTTAQNSLYQQRNRWAMDFWARNKGGLFIDGYGFGADRTSVANMQAGTQRSDLGQVCYLSSSPHWNQFGADFLANNLIVPAVRNLFTNRMRRGRYPGVGSSVLGDILNLASTTSATLNNNQIGAGTAAQTVGSATVTNNGLSTGWALNALGTLTSATTITLSKIARAQSLLQSRPNPPAVTIAVGSSVFSYVAPGPGIVTVSGGTITHAALVRQNITAVDSGGTTNQAFRVSAGDVVSVTYSGAPTMYFLPDGPLTPASEELNVAGTVQRLVVTNSADANNGFRLYTNSFAPALITQINPGDTIYADVEIGYAFSGAFTQANQGMYLQIVGYVFDSGFTQIINPEDNNNTGAYGNGYWASSNSMVLRSAPLQLPKSGAIGGVGNLTQLQLDIQITTPALSGGVITIDVGDVYFGKASQS